MRYLNPYDLEPHAWLYRKTTTCLEVSVIVLVWWDQTLLVTSTSINIP